MSVDGPRELHDAYRIDKKGKGSFDDVIRAWRILQAHQVDVNILCTVNAANAAHPLEVYRFFRDELGARYIQLIPIVERRSEGAKTCPPPRFRAVTISLEPVSPSVTPRPMSMSARCGDP